MSLGNINRLLGLLTRAADRRKPCEPVVMPYGDKPSFRKDVPFTPLPRVEPEERGIPSGQIAMLLDRVKREPSTGIESILVAKEDAVLCEAVFGIQKPGVWKASFSECKSITALAIGLLYDEGLVRLDEKIGDIFRDKVNALQRLSVGQVTVQGLLTMQSFATFNEGESNVTTDWIHEFFAGGTLPGKGFQYNSLNSYMLSAVVREKTGIGMGDYLRDRLFEPLGITNYHFERSPEGIEKGGWGLYILPEDLVKIGLMLAARGVWMGKRILSEEWINMMTKRHVSTTKQYGSFDYGLHIWVGRNQRVWLFNGMFGQNMLIYPDEKLVVAIHASNPDLFQTNSVFKICDQVFGGAEREWNDVDLGAIVASLRAQKEPQSWWKRLFNRDQGLPEACYSINGRGYVPIRVDATLGVMPRMMQMLENQYTTGLTSLSFRVEGKRFWLRICEGAAEYHIPVGFGEGEESRIRVGKTEWLISTLGRFGYDEDMRLVLVLEMAFLETPFHRYFRIYLEDDKLELRGDESPGRDFVSRFVETMGKDILEKPIVSGLVDKLDTDLLEYKLDVMFKPTLRMVKTTDPPKALKN